MHSHHTPNRICDTCGKPFHAFAYRIRSGGAKFCSVKCKRASEVPDVATRFWSKVERRGPDECWPFTGAIGSAGYGVFSLANRDTHASRVSWMLVNGPIPESLFVLHKCDNRPCCNPNHLFLGTHTDNVHDMMHKGRNRTLHGDDDPKSKLTEDEVRQIRALYRPRKFSQYRLAIVFGVSRSTIQSILERRNWRHVK